MKRALTIIAGLLISEAALAEDVDWTHPVVVTVDISNFKFAPAEMHFRHGQAYTIHLHNLSHGSHDFVAQDFFSKAQFAPTSQRPTENGRVELSGGGTSDITFIAPAAGTYEIHCSHFMHETMGMTGRIVVE